MRNLFLRSVAAVIVTLLPGVVSAGRIVECNTRLAPGEIGYLEADLDCPDGAVAVQMAPGSLLALNNHTITTHGSLSSGTFVICDGGHCTVQGPGRIFGERFTTGITSGRGTVTVRNLELDHVREAVLGGVHSRFVMTDVTTHHCTNACLSGDRIRATRVSSTNNTYYGVAVRSLTGTDIVVKDNSEGGIIAPDGTVTANRLTVTGNGYDGIFARRLTLRNSTVTGNDAAGDAIDINTKVRPHLTTTTCGKSQQTDQPLGTTWSVCTND